MFVLICWKLKSQQLNITTKCLHYVITEVTDVDGLIQLRNYSVITSKL